MTVETKQGRLRKNLEKKIQAKNEEIETAKKNLVALEKRHDEEVAAFNKLEEEKDRQYQEWRNRKRNSFQKFLRWWGFEFGGPPLGLGDAIGGLLTQSASLAVLSNAQEELGQLEEELDKLEQEYAELLADESTIPPDSPSVETEDDILAQIKSLHRKMTEEIANEPDSTLQKDIARIYGMKLQRLREKI